MELLIAAVVGGVVLAIVMLKVIWSVRCRQRTRLAHPHVRQ
jgi:hypothetical protein